MNVLKLLDPNIQAFSVLQTREEIVMAMEESGLEHASLLKGSEWLGYVSLSNLKESKGGNLDLLIDPVLSTFNLRPNQHLYEIYPSFQQSVLAAMAVIDNSNIYLGAASKKMIGQKLLDTLTYKGVGSIIVLNIYPTDFVLSRIANIVEENNAKIVGLMIEEVGQNYHVNLKLNTTEIAPMLASFQRFSIEVESYHSISAQEWDDNRAFEIAFKHFDL